VNSRSTTFRFAALVFLLQILTATALLLGVGAVLRSQARADAVDLAETVRTDLLATYADGGFAALTHAIQARTGSPSERTTVLFLTDDAGRAVAGSLLQVPRGVPPARGYFQVKALRHGQREPEAMLVRATRLANGGMLVTGTVVESQRHIFALLERATLAALALSIVFAGFAAFASTRLILNRLRDTITTLGRVRAGELSRRVPRDETGDAFARLGHEVNQALDRVEALNAELKLATDGLAHDFKSPLTRLRSALDRIVRTVDSPQALEAVDQALAESERLIAMIETALSITRAEAGIGRESFVPTDLSEMLATIVEIYAPLVEDGGRRIDLEAPATCILPVHRQLLEQALGNLVDNAIKYATGTITLSLDCQPTGASVTVRDEGMGIPEDQRAQALRRFTRLDEARGGWGAGLGLSLVQAVAHLHGGTVDLRDGAPGLAVTIHLGPLIDDGSQAVESQR